MNKETGPNRIVPKVNPEDLLEGKSARKFISDFGGGLYIGEVLIRELHPQSNITNGSNISSQEVEGWINSLDPVSTDKVDSYLDKLEGEFQRANARSSIKYRGN